MKMRLMRDREKEDRVKGTYKIMNQDAKQLQAEKIDFDNQVKMNDQKFRKEFGGQDPVEELI